MTLNVPEDEVIHFIARQMKGWLSWNRQLLLLLIGSRIHGFVFVYSSRTAVAQRWRRCTSVLGGRSRLWTTLGGARGRHGSL